MALTNFGPSWTEGVQVEERRLQEYLHKKQHGLLLRGAAQTMQHTLEPMPTTNSTDGCVHLGDSLMLRSCHTGGLLQADVGEKVEVQDTSRAAATGFPLSTGILLAACARNVLVVSRVSDDDGFENDGCLHYGQTIRLGAGPQLHERPLYLYACAGGAKAEPLEEDQTLMCLYARATAGTHWRVVRAAAPAGAADDVVRLGTGIRLENVATGHALGADQVLRMTTYGNEGRVFGTAPRAEGDPDVATTTWSFVDSQWAEEVIMAARKAMESREVGENDVEDGGHNAKKYLEGLYIPRGWKNDPGELLTNAEKRADHDLKLLEGEEGAPARKVLARIFPMIRGRGMHIPRRLRRMCVQADTHGEGTLPIRTFAGLLSFVGVRLQEEELQPIFGLLKAPSDRQEVDYRRFFALMSPPMAELRGTVVRDAYAKLRAQANANLVEVPDLQRQWKPQCHPDVQNGVISESEAREDFLRQWDIASADGLVTYEEFLDYYQDVSLAVESHEIFVEIVRRAWGL